MTELLEIVAVGALVVLTVFAWLTWSAILQVRTATKLTAKLLEQLVERGAK